jgi:hypothetical protein
MTIGGGAKNPKLVCGRGKECGHSEPLEEGRLEAAAAAVAAANGTADDDSPADDEPEAPKRDGKSRAAAAAP